MPHQRLRACRRPSSQACRFCAAKLAWALIDWMAVHLMARTRPTWRSPQTLVFVMVLFGVSFTILGLIDAHTITAHAERCPYQFPTKWFGCVLANHESISGGLVGAVGALLAAWFAWHAIMAQIESNRAATMAQIESDRAIARKADRAYVTGGPGRRMVDKNQNHIGIVSTGMNTGQTPAFTKKVYWGICRKDDWLDVGKTWPQVKRSQSARTARRYCRLRWPLAIDTSSRVQPRRSLTMARTMSATARSFTPQCSETNLPPAGSIRWCA